MGFFNRLFFDFGTSIGVDLGTASILIYVKNKGIVLNEPSVVAMNQLTHEIIAIGAPEEATQAQGGRAPRADSARAKTFSGRFARAQDLPEHGACPPCASERLLVTSSCVSPKNSPTLNP